MDAAKRLATNVFLVCLLAGMAVDALPSAGEPHSRLKRAISPLLDASGLWQGSWALFAPEPDKLNVRISADLVDAEGRRTIWRSPEWRTMSAFERFAKFRHAEYLDSIWRSPNAGAWPALAMWIAEHATHDIDHADPTTEIVLRTHKRVIAGPPWRRTDPPSANHASCIDGCTEDFYTLVLNP